MHHILVALGAVIPLLLSLSVSAQPLVKVNGTEIPESQVAEKMGGQYLKARTQCYDAKKGVVDSFLFEHLVGLEAEKKKTTRDKLLRDEIEKKSKKVTDKDVKEIYDNFQKRSKAQGRNAPPFDQVSGQIKQRLTQDTQRERRETYFADLKRKYQVAYEFDRPRVTVGKGDNPRKGPANAPITIVEFSDFECPFCKRVTDEAVTEVLKKYRGKVQMYFRDFPLSFHRKAKPAAAAARCAGKQGKFWEYHDKLFLEQKLADEDLKKYAKKLKLDMTKFEACLTDDKIMKSIDKDTEAGADVGVSGTPAFFINGVPLSGAVPFTAFKEIIDEELASLGKKTGTVMP